MIQIPLIIIKTTVVLLCVCQVYNNSKRQQIGLKVETKKSKENYLQISSKGFHGYLILMAIENHLVEHI